MTSPWDCSELQEAASLLSGLMATAAPAPTAPAPASPDVGVSAPAPGAPAPTAPAPAPGAPAPTAPAPVPGAPVDLSDLRYRGDQLERVLASLCTRAGFHGALVADAYGLPVAVHEVPMDVDQAAAFASVLGDALEQADRLLGRAGANHISMDVDFADKIVLHHFGVAGAGYHLLVVSRQDVEDRAEIELSVTQIAEVLEG